MTGDAVSHGAAVPRGLHAAGADGRFGRMFPSLAARPLSDGAIDALLDIIADASQVIAPINPKIPAGYTHLGQFVDHDLTFDPTSQLDKDNDPHALANFRTPRFDLDSLYGAGPADQPYLYELDTPSERVKLLIGKSPRCATGATVDDLPRNEQGRALVGDARNDEQLIISQLHLLFAKFHNKVVDRVAVSGLQGGELLREAQRIVRWHYQWIVVHDFLRRITGDGTAWRVLSPGERGPTVNLAHFRCEGAPSIPVEFSGAAYRFGHSMVRNGYSMNEGDLEDRPVFKHPSLAKHLGGFRWLPHDSVIDWSMFFAIPGHADPQSSHKHRPRHLRAAASRSRRTSRSRVSGSSRG